MILWASLAPATQEQLKWRMWFFFVLHLLASGDSSSRKRSIFRKASKGPFYSTAFCSAFKILWGKVSSLTDDRWVGVREQAFVIVAPHL